VKPALAMVKSPIVNTTVRITDRTIVLCPVVEPPPTLIRSIWGEPRLIMGSFQITAQFCELTVFPKIESLSQTELGLVGLRSTFVRDVGRFPLEDDGSGVILA
jgi:hypothetical protein